MGNTEVYLERLGPYWRVRKFYTFEYLQLKGKYSLPVWTSDVSSATIYGSKMSARHSANANGLKVTEP